MQLHVCVCVCGKSKHTHTQGHVCLCAYAGPTLQNHTRNGSSDGHKGTIFGGERWHWLAGSQPSRPTDTHYHRHRHHHRIQDGQSLTPLLHTPSLHGKTARRKEDTSSVNVRVTDCVFGCVCVRLSKKKKKKKKKAGRASQSFTL